MKLEYNPRNVLRVVSTPLLQEYFGKRQRSFNIWAVSRHSGTALCFRPLAAELEG